MRSAAARSPAATARAAAPIAALVYRSGDRCPSCWSTSFHVGRSTAECARCGNPLALGEPGRESRNG